jgi:hypothetical protein
VVWNESASEGGAGDAGMGGGMSKDSPRQPAFWRLAGFGVGGGLGGCARTLAVKSASYRARVTCACFAPGADEDVGVGAHAETDGVREEVDVREVVVPCEKRDERSEPVVAVDWTDVHADGGRERGTGPFVGGIATATAGGGGGGTRRVFWREREELLAEEVRVWTGEPTPVFTGVKGLARWLDRHRCPIISSSASLQMKRATLSNGISVPTRIQRTTTLLDTTTSVAGRMTPHAPD